MNNRGYLSAAVDAHPVVKRFDEILAITHTTPSDIAGPAPVADATIRMMLATGQLPSRRGPRNRIIEWVELNAGVQSRKDLKFL